MHVRLSILPAAVLAAAACAAAEPTAERLLPLHDGRDAYRPAAAFGGDVFLAVWQSGRLAPGDLREGLTFNGDIVACRLDADGRPLDAQPLVVCAAADLQERPRVAFGGGVFLVVWHDARNGRDWDVYAARVTPEGKLLDADGILVSGGPRNQAAPQVAWDGRAFQVVWQDYRGGQWYQVYAARVSAEGKLLDPGGVRIASGDWYNCYAPAVASAGGGRSFLLYVANSLPVDGYRTPAAVARFLADGKPAGEPTWQNKDARRTGPAGNAHPIALAAGGSVFLAAWKTFAPLGRGNAPNDADMALFDAAGARTADLSVASVKGGRILDPDVAWDGSAFIVAWHEFERLDRNECPHDVAFAARIAPEGRLLGPVLRLSGTLAGPAGEAAVASDGKGTTVAVYLKYPATADVPIHVAARVLKPAAAQQEGGGRQP